MARLEQGMTKTSRWLRGHDDPGAVDEPLPPPGDVLRDIEELEAWRREIHALRQG